MRVLLAGLAWAVAYGLVWAVAWFAFMRGAWYDALAAGNRQMPWNEIWIIWTVLTVPMGIATAAFLRPRDGAATRSNALVSLVLVLWVPMTLGMFGWAWFDSISLLLITVDSAVNLAALALASVLARAIVTRQSSQPVASVAS